MKLVSRLTNYFKKKQTKTEELDSRNTMLYNLNTLINSSVDGFNNAYRQAINYKWTSRLDLIEYYKKFQKDNYYDCCYQLKKGASLQADFQIYKGDKEIDLTNELVGIYRNISPYIFDAMMYGDTALQRINGKYELLDRRFIIPETKEYCDRFGNRTNIGLKSPNILYITNIDYPYGRFINCVRNLIIKDLLQYQWASYTQKYGMPIAIIKSDSNDKDMMKSLSDGIANMRSEFNLAIPNDVDLTLLDGQKNDVYNVFNTYIITLNKEISAMMLGSTGLISVESNRSQTNIFIRICWIL